MDKILNSIRTQYRAAFRSMACGGHWDILRKRGTDEFILAQRDTMPDTFTRIVRDVQAMTETHVIGWIQGHIKHASTNVTPDYGYLHHGQGTAGPFRTERVHVEPRGWPHAGEWLARFEGKWRVVHVRSVKGSPYIVFQGEKINIQIEGV